MGWPIAPTDEIVGVWVPGVGSRGRWRLEPPLCKPLAPRGSEGGCAGQLLRPTSLSVSRFVGVWIPWPGANLSEIDVGSRVT